MGRFDAYPGNGGNGEAVLSHTLRDAALLSAHSWLRERAVERREQRLQHRLLCVAAGGRVGAPSPISSRSNIESLKMVVHSPPHHPQPRAR